MRGRHRISCIVPAVALGLVTLAAVSCTGEKSEPTDERQAPADSIYPKELAFVTARDASGHVVVDVLSDSVRGGVISVKKGSELHSAIAATKEYVISYLPMAWKSRWITASPGPSRAQARSRTWR